MQDMENFDRLGIGLASPEKMREWSKGEVKKPETINYRTLKPERDGLFCEKIFGPTKDWECYCGKYKKVRYKGIICDRCGVEVTKKKVRRERMGHIELACPISHIWYFKGIPGRMSLMLDISPKALEKVIYFASYVVLDPKNTTLSKCDVLNEKEYRDAIEQFGAGSFKVGMGAESIQQLLKGQNLTKLRESLYKDLDKATGQKQQKIIKRLETVDAFLNSGNSTEWMILNVIPVIPPELRPMVQLDGGRFATSDLNDLYRRVINRNNRLKKLIELEAPDIIVRNEKRMLQEAVDALIDNGRRGKPITGAGGRPLKSLSDMLKGKQGRFRQNLLGKRVDYSGRSVIVVGPELKIHQCGLPREMALELFKPFVMKELVKRGKAFNIKNAKRMVERTDVAVWDILEEVITDRPVMLNRAPTLHRLGIQAFEPVLVEGRAIKLHPLVCTAFNADFDGDQMAVHVPLSPEAVAETKCLMLASNNLLKLQDGKPVAVPSQDMILGSYYLTMELPNEPGEGMIFSDMNEAMMAYDEKFIGIHAPIKIRITKDIGGTKVSKIIDTTIGKMIFNKYIPQDIGFIDRSDIDNEFRLEVEFPVRKKELGIIIDKCIATHGIPRTAEVLDEIKANGFKYSTKAAVTVSVSDIEIPQIKYELLEKAETKVEIILKNFKRGLISDEERYNETIKTWAKVTEEIQEAVMNNPNKLNPIHMMAHTGARGNPTQIRQLAGIRGLMSDTSGKTIELPIKSCFKEGLDVLEFFISSHGARKGLADTALRTADSGYLTRRLVDVNQDIIIMEDDCKTDQGLYVEDILESGEPIEKVTERIEGRFLAEDIFDDEGNMLYIKNTYINDDMAKRIVSIGKIKVKIRSALTCESIRGVCAKCYGKNLATGDIITAGEAVGVIAAQSIGEPGTQLTMRTFHTGGVAGGDITQGLPRVEELFEARKPKGVAMISEICGTVTIGEVGNNKEVIVTDDEKYVEKYLIPYGMRLVVHAGDKVVAGDRITEGSLDPHDIIRIRGDLAVQNYLIQEVQKVYRTQGVHINDKHIEIVARQMLRKIYIENKGNTELLNASTIDMNEYNAENKRVKSLGLKPAVGRKTLLGITKIALSTESFLSAASFQETSRVLTDAAIKGKVDKLQGLKENVIIGRLIPAGTGVVEYSELEVEIPEDIEEKELNELENITENVNEEISDMSDFIQDDEIETEIETEKVAEEE
ncbi:MAG: DNA-directed RNA polymerase subunit beta' [Clostridia bacterium]|nr:DNA-directed RNA polymerase subunit beta' [Clostridia bacterium]MDD4386208.1 DNA-directed RNA polymerase subunit beta' [Clostridia bacterium]